MRRVLNVLRGDVGDLPLPVGLVRVFAEDVRHRVARAAPATPSRSRRAAPPISVGVGLFGDLDDEQRNNGFGDALLSEYAAQRSEMSRVLFAASRASTV